MGLFSNYKTDGLEETQDRLGGFTVFDTDVYKAKIKMAYASPSREGAMGIFMEFDLGGRDYRETFWVSNKAGENFFMAKDKDGKPTGKKSALPGFTVVNDICLVTVEKELSEIEPEDKVVNVYDYDAKKEMPKSVPVLTELLGQEVDLAIWKNLEDKTKEDGKGNYVPTGETRDTNSVDKVFHASLGLTVPEARAGSEPKFKDAWVERNKGKVRDRTSKKGGTGTAGAPPTAGASGGTSGTPARTSLFGSKS